MGVRGRRVLAEEESKKEHAQDARNRDGIQERVPRQDVAMAEVASMLDSIIEILTLGVLRVSKNTEWCKSQTGVTPDWQH